MTVKRTGKPETWRRRANAMKRAKWLQEMVVRSLGAKCDNCGVEDLSMLSVDHPRGITWDRRKLRYDARIEKYIWELVNGVELRCLCLVCNGRFGREMQQAKLDEPGAVADALDAVHTDLQDSIAGVTKNVTEDLPEAPF